MGEGCNEAPLAIPRDGVTAVVCSRAGSGPHPSQMGSVSKAQLRPDYIEPVKQILWGTQ